KHDGAALECLQQHTGMQQQGFIITPCNPYSQRLDDKTNQQRLTSFRGQLKASSVIWIPTVNQDADNNWPDEPGALLIDCSRDFALQLGRQFEQNAVLEILPDTAPQLVWLV